MMMNDDIGRSMYMNFSCEKAKTTTKIVFDVHPL